MTVPSSVAELRERVDALGGDVARLTREIEALEPELRRARKRASAARDRLARERERRQGVGGLVFDTLATLLGWLPFLPVLIVPFAVVSSIMEACDDTPLRMTALGSAMTGPDHLLGGRCDVVARAAGGSSCRVTIDCDGEPVFDDEAPCEMDARTREDSDGDTHTYHVLVVRGDPRLELDAGLLTATVKGGAVPVRVFLHELSTEGSL